MKENNEIITIDCPECGNPVMKYNTKDTLPIEAMCKKCRRVVQYNPTRLGKTTKFIKKPRRNTSSGVRFY